jgi:response regulator RpfG family c-di-GMP phosphodiesterase
VDDEDSIRKVLEFSLTKHGYRVLTAATGTVALRLAEKQPIQLIILDVLLGDEDGLGLLETFKAARAARPVIMMTGFDFDDELMRQASEKGAAGFVSKNLPVDHLLALVQDALVPKNVETPEIREPAHLQLGRSDASEREAPSNPSLPAAQAFEPFHEQARGRLVPASQVVTSRPHPDGVHDPNAHRASAEAVHEPTPSPLPGGEPAAITKETVPVPMVIPDPDAFPSRATESMPVAQRIVAAPEGERFDFGLEALVRLLSAYHPNLGNTAMRAVAFCRTLGKVSDLPANPLQNLLWAAALHDVGFVPIDVGIVRRWMRDPGKCTKEEIALIERHPMQSQAILEFCPIFKEAGEIIRAHHENWDGSGYPDGLKMEMIPWLSRLLAVVIFYCSKPTANEKSLAAIKALANTFFDPRAVEAVIESAPFAKLPRGEREFIAYELKSGMVLAADIANRDGVLILAKGKELTSATIRKIVHLNNTAEINPYILVYS